MAMYSTITGHLGGNAEIKQVGGKPVVKFSIASNDPFDKEAGPIWVSCDMWREPGKLLDFLTKGKHVMVNGRQGQYLDKEGKPRISLRVENLELLGDGKPREEGRDRVATGDGATRSTRDDNRDRNRGPANAGGGGGRGRDSRPHDDDDIPFCSASLDAEPSPIARVIR